MDTMAALFNPSKTEFQLNADRLKFVEILKVLYILFRYCIWSMVHTTETQKNIAVQINAIKIFWLP